MTDCWLRKGVPAPCKFTSPLHYVSQHVLVKSESVGSAFVVQVGSVSTIIAEQLHEKGLDMEAAEATLLALGIHADTGSLTFDSATSRYGSIALRVPLKLGPLRLGLVVASRFVLVLLFVDAWFGVLVAPLVSRCDWPVYRSDQAVYQSCSHVMGRDVT